MGFTSSKPNREGGQPRVSLTASGVVVPHPSRWHQRLIAWLVFFAERILTATLRYQWVDGSNHLTEPNPGPAIYCIWHNRLVLSMTAYSAYITKKSKTSGLAALVSASRDGGLLSAALQRFKVQPVRGSSSRRGRQALLELTTWAERGYDLAITPDGPRGPRYSVKEGITSLAQLTGLPVIPVSFNYGWKIQAQSWDQFQIPLPFSRCEMIFGEAIHVPREASDEQREALRLQLEQTLNRISRD
jgi:lysophospholipid acyltransferase (LPLAT)-like uncharacterized protein